MARRASSTDPAPYQVPQRGPRGEEVWVRRSRRRRRSVEIRLRDGRLVVAIPDTYSRTQEREAISSLIDRYGAKMAAHAPAARSDDDLSALAAELSDRHLGGRAVPRSITWTSRQNQRWGSCTPSTGTIRLSDRLQGMPDWVVRSVVMHELVHLIEPGHGPAFQELLHRYPLAERADGFLRGYARALDGAGPDVPEEDVEEPGADGDAAAGETAAR